uniref:Uncharacterized protein n=1 Tax=Rhizophora mucronata TaxID=61149 RepID=A0A2P2NUM8_RHIMU
MGMVISVGFGRISSDHDVVKSEVRAICSLKNVGSIAKRV